MKLKKPGYIESGKHVKTDESELVFIEDKLEPGKLKENPRNLFDKLEEEDYNRLKSDIKERGIVDPLICDKNFVLLTGHNRLSIAKELNLKKIPVRILQTELSPKEKEKLLVLDNLNRRQLTYEEKKKFIALYYEDDLQKDNRGGDRKTEIKSSPELLNLPLNLAKKIERETGIKEGTAKRIVADIRKESKPKKANDSKPGNVTKTIKEQSSKAKLQARLKEVQKEIKILQNEERKLKNQIGKMK